MRTILVVAIATLFSPSLAPAAEAPCHERDDTRIWYSPQEPVAGGQLRVMVVSESLRNGDVQVTLPGSKPLTLPTTRRGGPPFSFYAEVKTPTAGAVRVELVETSGKPACRRIQVAARGKSAAATRPDSAGAWRATAAWNRTTESFFSAWIEHLFAAPSDASLGFPSLAPVLHDPARNFLWGHLGLREDDPKNRGIPRAVPDCADLPYYLRAYFAWKLGLPFGLRDCDRGKTDRAPKCGGLFHNESPDASIKGSSPLDRFRSFLRILANRVHSGSARTALHDEETDFYPVTLERKTVRPGTIYADPYGHVLMVSAWVDQTTERGGLLFAVDGQPDNSVGRKRFWEGTFMFANDMKSAGPGFKAFRPVVRGPDGVLAQIGNKALGSDARFAPYSDEQARLGRDAFYARVGKLINPNGLDARTAYAETMNALVEQLTTRVGSVDNGERYMREKGSPVIPMPTGPRIFETTGPWEDYATPSRDMRLLIAMRVLVGLPEKISQHPELFLLGGRKPADVRTEIETLHEREIRQRSVEYRRSDGTPFRLTVADVLARRAALEMAYNPNDCVETRWGATPETPDFATCVRHAPEDQRARMQEYRTWFQEARRPPR